MASKANRQGQPPSTGTPLPDERVETVAPGIHARLRCSARRVSPSLLRGYRRRRVPDQRGKPLAHLLPGRLLCLLTAGQTLCWSMQMYYMRVAPVLGGHRIDVAYMIVDAMAQRPCERPGRFTYTFGSRLVSVGLGVTAGRGGDLDTTHADMLLGLCDTVMIGAGARWGCGSHWATRAVTSPHRS